MTGFTPFVVVVGGKYFLPVPGRYFLSFTNPFFKLKMP